MWRSFSRSNAMEWRPSIRQRSAGTKLYLCRIVWAGYTEGQHGQSLSSTDVELSGQACALAYRLLACRARAHVLDCLAAGARCRRDAGDAHGRSGPPDAAAQFSPTRPLKTCVGWAFAGMKVLTKAAPLLPYQQSRRQAIYLAAWRKLLRGGFLFPCHCSRKDLETALGAPHESSSPSTQSGENHGKHEHLDDEPVYPGTCRHLQGFVPQLPGRTGIEFDTPEDVNWRFRVPDGEVIEFEDRNLGPQRFVAGQDFGDFVVWRRDGVPSYQLACVADDAAMGITEVVRGADLLKSTARQILLHRALGFGGPQWYHCPPGGGPQRASPRQAP